MHKQAPPPVRSSIRLFVPGHYTEHQRFELPAAQAHYLANVMRCQSGDSIRVFNGTAGEWQAEIEHIAKKSLVLRLVRPLLPHIVPPDVWLAFAPIRGKVDVVVEKAVELGVSRIIPVFMQRCVVTSLNKEKLALTAVEAAEQSERHEVPAIAPQRDLATLLSTFPEGRLLLHADETGSGVPLAELLQKVPPAQPLAVLVGPEGGIALEERMMLAAQPFVRAFGMGPRIMRADTACTSALACVLALRGDWHHKPHFLAAEAS